MTKLERNKDKPNYIHKSKQQKKVIQNLVRPQKSNNEGSIFRTLVTHHALLRSLGTLQSVLV